MQVALEDVLDNGGFRRCKLMRVRRFKLRSAQRRRRRAAARWRRIGLFHRRKRLRSVPDYPFRISSGLTANHRLTLSCLRRLAAVVRQTYRYFIHSGIEADRKDALRVC
jgi:hypothetical protein